MICIKIQCRIVIKFGLFNDLTLAFIKIILLNTSCVVVGQLQSFYKLPISKLYCSPPRLDIAVVVEFIVIFP